MYSENNRKTLYEELEVEEAALPEEVRSAYLHKAKATHPDKSPEGVNRQESELRMTRLNAVMDVLGNEDKRAAYDNHLRSERRAEAADLRQVAVAASLEARRRSRYRRKRKGVFVALGVAFCLIIGSAAILLVGDSKATQPWQVQGRPSLEVKVAKTQVEEKPKANSEWKSDPAQSSVEPVVDSVPAVAKAQIVPTAQMKDRQAVSPLLEEAQIAMGRKREAPVEVPAPVAMTAPAAHVSAIPATQPAKGAWNGNWKYLPTAGSGTAFLFSPISIRLYICTNGLRVNGVYEARYRVDRRYSDRVAFSMEGLVDSPEVLKGLWQNAAGTKGEFEIKKVEGQVVEMNWWTTEFARKDVLASGGARLTEVR